ncbi:phosphate transport system permease protein PstC [Halarchaeum acidiphilum MH1-52-1]|uniref:Phosphate transport system permease protein n=2 Tax=Halarchaeum acidiphilum TaxID=489138 RepID=U2YXG0_9EURY|nr:phosphate ABC transporter permease subunit PstC [Halarchaeum acidiphilum]GAD53735.1 phosphate transport system permease protein PstC [Halarchaeum acidiphilum MH1-52-1]
MSTADGGRFGRLQNLDEGTRRVGAGSAVTIVATVAAFLLFPAATIYPLLGFLAVVAYGWWRYQEATAKVVMALMTASTVVILGLITLYLLWQSVPVLRQMGIGLLTHVGATMWSPNDGVFSLVPMMWGTFLTTIIAMCVAGPLGIAGALFTSEMAPRWAREIIKPAIEVLAGIPSIVYGFLGFVIVNDYMMRELSLPIYGSLFGAGVVIGLMALPTIVSVAEDALAAVPDEMKDGSVALGATSWQTITAVTLPSAFSGVSAAIILGVGRALGETMAVTVMLAHTQTLPDPLYDVFGPNGQETLTSLIASQYGIASGDHMSALFAAGVVLFITVLTLSIGSQLVEARMREKLGGGA